MLVGVKCGRNVLTSFLLHGLLRYLRDRWIIVFKLSLLCEFRSARSYTVWNIYLAIDFHVNCHTVYACFCMQFDFSFLCLVVDCGDPGNPQNGRRILQGGTTFQSNVTYECNTGFRLEGVALRTCRPLGIWSGSQPSCTRK